MIIITGGAGFIGSALVWALNQRGKANILLVDEIDHDEKEHNIAPLRYEEQISIGEFRQKLLAGDFKPDDIDGILHMGACSDTTESDWEYLLDNNVEYSKDIIRWCADNGVRCVYASSAATYGAGEKGYDDDPKLFDALNPLNLYGKSKLLVDIWARDGKYLNNVAGVRYFNVYGPNEYHKEHMRSVITKKYEQISEHSYIELFKSNHPDFTDGEQKRDFIYIKDAVEATLWLFDQPTVNGAYNIGTGRASTWNEVAQAMFAALGKPVDIRYIDMPQELASQYQNFTEANMSRLQQAGYTAKPTPLAEAVAEHVVQYLAPHVHLGEI